MAQIVPTDAAPDEKVHYSFSSASFDLAPGDSFDTDDSTLLSDIKGHPWLSVKIEEADSEEKVAEAVIEPVSPIVEETAVPDVSLDAVPAVDEGVQNGAEAPKTFNTTTRSARR